MSEKYRVASTTAFANHTFFTNIEMSFIKEYVVGDLIEKWDFYECEDFNDEVLAKKYDMTIDQFQILKSKLL
jgi:hypothetical protein